MEVDIQVVEELQAARPSKGDPRSSQVEGEVVLTTYWRSVVLFASSGDGLEWLEMTIVDLRRSIRESPVALFFSVVSRSAAITQRGSCPDGKLKLLCRKCYMSESGL